jgi:hypothetical protein
MWVSMMGIGDACASVRRGIAAAAAAVPARKSLRVTGVIRAAGYVRPDQLSTLNTKVLEIIQQIVSVRAIACALQTRVATKVLTLERR